MYYYDAHNKRVLNEQQFSEMGLDGADDDYLLELNIYRLKIGKPEYDPETQGLQTDGEPVPAMDDDPLLVYQPMRVVNLLDDAKDAALAEIARKRYEHQSMPIRFPDGSTFSASAESQARIAATIAAHPDETDVLDYKTPEGYWHSITIAQLKLLFQQTDAFVQECYRRERELSEAIREAETLSDLYALPLERGWPDPDFFVEMETANKESAIIGDTTGEMAVMAALGMEPEEPEYAKKLKSMHGIRVMCGLTTPERLEERRK